MTSPAAISAWSAAGFVADLLPICGPDHGCASPGKVPHLLGWRTMEITPAMVASWARSHRGNVGLRTARYPAVDIDVEDPELADACERVALVTLGSTARRTRSNTGRRLLLYRVDGEPFGKVAVSFVSPGGEKAKVEILADGQQCVIGGVHHTRAAIEWPAGQPNAEGLATMDLAGRDALLLALRRRLAELGCIVEGVERQERPPARVIPMRPRPRPTRARMGDADLAYWALEQLDADCPYNMWIRVGMAIHSRWPDEGGLDLWAAWSARAHDRFPGRRALEVKWRSFAAGKGVRVGSLVRMARRGGI